jgi:AcrR family transcriptional regulator
MPRQAANKSNSHEHVKKLTPRQQSRRSKILGVARELLAKRGYDGVTMRELARQSRVATKTLYDVYGSKDELLMVSVKDRVAMVFHAAEAAAGDLTGVARVLYFVERGMHATMVTPKLSRAVAPFVAGPEDHFGMAEIYERCHGRGLREMEAAGELQPWADIPTLLSQLALTVTGVLQLWARDQIKSKHLVVQSQLAAAQVLAPTVRGEALKEVTSTIREIYRGFDVLESGRKSAAARKARGGIVRQKSQA